jgi:alcohol dehydrogenase class IV
MNLPSFQHVAPPLRLFQGDNSLVQLGRELDRLKSRRAVIFCGASLAGDTALLDLVQAAMGERFAGIFKGVQAHSPLPMVLSAAQELLRLNADAVVAVGGGSAIVTARAASILAAEGIDAWRLCTTVDDQGVLRSPKLLAPKIAQLIIPTTPTTAMVKAGSAVFDPATGQRLALFDPKTRAGAIFIHPAMLQSAPRTLLVSASLNTFAMAVEGLMSRTGNPLSDGLLMHALRLLMAGLGEPDRHDQVQTRAELVLAALLCGQGTDHAGAGITTVLGHAIGARFATENGITNAIVLPHCIRFNAEAGREGLQKVATALGLAAGHETALVEVVNNAAAALFDKLGVPSRLQDLGVPQDALTGIATTAMGDWFLRGNPRPVRDVTQLKQILEQAW